MNISQPVRSCVEKVIQDFGSGIKSMILDEFTTSVVSVGFTRPELLLREVYLFEHIDTIFESNEKLNHTKCIVILRPTKVNIELLCRELQRPHYRSYHIHFTNRIGQTTIKMLAEADETEVVRDLCESPLDFVSITPFLFTLKLQSNIYNIEANTWHADGLKRTSEGLISLLSALNLSPMVRYQTQSTLCQALAERICNMNLIQTTQTKLSKSIKPDTDCLLLIVDRRSDLVTPIINKWSYYDMLHEQFDIQNNRINLTNVQNRTSKDPKEMLISIYNDKFFGENYFRSYGELGAILKDAVSALRDNTQSQQKVETLEDMKRFIDEYPEVRKYKSSLHNHVFVMSELTRIVTEHKLFEVSECEQELACGAAGYSDLIKDIKQLIGTTLVRPKDAVRLTALYVLCRPDSKDGLSELMRMLKARGDIITDDLEYIQKLKVFNSSKPYNPLEHTMNQVTKLITKGVIGVDNILSQFKPDICKVLDDLRKNRMKESEFAFCRQRYRDEVPRKIVVFYIGGITYEEALAVDSINKEDGYTWIVAGGTTLLNSDSFKHMVTDCTITRNK